jgi:hypothetical protein
VPIAPSGRVEDIIQTSDGSYLAVGSSDWNGAVWRSTDGIAWSEIANVPPIAPEDAKGLTGVIQTANGYLAWGGGGLRYSEGGFSIIWTSADGTHWLERAGWTGFLLDVAEGGPGFVGVGSMAGLDNLNGTLAWSSIDGITWTESPQVPGEGGGMLDIVPIEGGFLAVGASRGEGGWIRGLTWSSQDGVHWAVVSDDEIDGALSRVAVHDGRLVAGGSITVGPINGGLERPVIRVSEDGSAWKQSFARDCCGYITDIVGAGDGMLAAFRWWIPDAETGEALLRSLDGEHWDEIGAPELEPGILWLHLMHLGGSLGVFGIGIRDIGNDAYQPVLLLPPADLISH